MKLPGTTDVFIAGGGPAGLASAIAARRRGFDVTVADPAVPPIDKACGEGLMPDGVHAARSLGIELDCVPAFPFRGIRFHDRNATVAAAFPNGVGLGMRRTTLHQRMVEIAADAGVRLAWGTPVNGLRGDTVMAGGQEIKARWIVGADGGQSRVRRWAGLDASHHESTRYGFRAHYRIAPWTDLMEIYWADGCQIYITPISASEICLALISRNPHLRLSAALPEFPAVTRRLAAAAQSTPERGALSVMRRLKNVQRGRVALIGDASGSVDAITGEGLCLLFQQSAALAAAMEAGDLEQYQQDHRRIGRRPEIMARLMLLLDRSDTIRHGAVGAMAAVPRLFAGLLATHVGKPGSAWRTSTL